MVGWIKRLYNMAFEKGFVHGGRRSAVIVPPYTVGCMWVLWI